MRPKSKPRRLILLLPLAFLVQAQTDPADGDKPQATLSTPGPDGRHTHQPIMPPEVFAQPREASKLAGSRIVAVAEDALLAEHVLVIDRMRLESENKTVLGAPFRLTMPAGTPANMRLIDGRRSPCVLPDNELRDGRDLFSEICFLDIDGDGRSERARFISAEPGVEPRDVTAQPVGFRLSSGSAPYPMFIARQRLRVEKVTASDFIIIRETSVGSAAPGDVAWSRYGGTPGRSQIRLRLRRGERTEVDGFILTVRPSGAGSWDVSIEGDFNPWVELRDNDTVVRAGWTTLWPR